MELQNYSPGIRYPSPFGITGAPFSHHNNRNFFTAAVMYVPELFRLVLLEPQEQ